MASGGDRRDSALQGDELETVDSTPWWSSEVVATMIMILLVIAATLVVVLVQVPRREPKFTDPTFVEVLFSNRVTVTAVRVGIFYAAVYAVISVMALSLPVGGGPAASEPVQGLRVGQRDRA